MDRLNRKQIEEIQFNFEIKNLSTENRVDGNYGIVEGYLATWDLDRGNAFGVRDQFVKGAFTESIADYLSRGRHIRLKDHHGPTVGIIRVDAERSIYEDDRGLFVKGELNLDLVRARELYSLAKQGAITDWSIGFQVIEYTEDKGVRTITKAYIWEGSLVDEPMNPHATITNVKSAVPFQDLPIADSLTEWDEKQALSHVQETTESKESASEAFKRAFLWYNKEHPNLLSSYKYMIADVLDGVLTVVPEAIYSAAESIKVDPTIPEIDKPAVMKSIERYYAKMGKPSPFNDDEKRFIIFGDIKNVTTPRDLEKMLRQTGSFSREAAKALAGRVKFDIGQKGGDNIEDELDIKSVLDALNGIKESIEHK